jgi:hypothetical protein
MLFSHAPKTNPVPIVNFLLIGSFKWKVDLKLPPFLLALTLLHHSSYAKVKSYSKGAGGG